MAVLTQIAGQHMGRVLTILDDIVMASKAARGGAVVHEGRGPVGACMTTGTIVTTGDMSGVFTLRDGSVVTTETGAKHLVVVNPAHLCPVRGDMAGFTPVRGLHVSRALTILCKSVMATETVAADRVMHEIRRFPCLGRVANQAVITTRNMCGAFPRQQGVVMTTDTGTNDLIVIDPDQIVPAAGPVAVLAQITCREMARPLAIRGRTVMATGTTVGHIFMFEIGRNPGVSGVTDITLLSRLNVPVRHTARTGNRTVVTAAAGADHIGMIHPTQGFPLTITMTILADIQGRNVITVFALDSETVMTTEAVLCDDVVSEVRRCPAICRVAIGTGIATDDMPGALTWHQDVVVAIRAGADDLVMIDPVGFPTGVAVTVLAQIAGGNMVVALARQGAAVMAARTTARDLFMFEIGRNPAIGRVTVGTIIPTDDVIRRLARYHPVVVTTETAAQYKSVINDGVRLLPSGDLMTAFADISRLNMLRRFTQSGDTVVAGSTVTGHAIVIIIARTPGDGIVAIITGTTIDGDMGR